MHGTSGGAPKGNRNALKQEKEITALIRMDRKIMAAIE